MLDERTLSQADIQRILDEGIAASVQHAWDHSPWWRQYIQSHGLSPADLSSAQGLRRLPPVGKDVVSSVGRGLWAVPGRQVVDISTTSGTSGQPTLYPLTAADLQRLGYNEYLSFTVVGVGPDDTVLQAVTMDRCIMAGLAYYQGLVQTGATTLRAGAASPAILLDLLERTGATTVVSVPSFLDNVARFATGEEVDLAASTVQRLVCIGETMRRPDFSLNALGQRLESQWGAQVHASYGITELASSLTECEAGLGGHLHPELLHVEILGEDDEPLPPGEPGDLVATPLGVQGLPLLRFRTGDVAALYTGRCACGRCTPRLGPVLGRRQQMLKLKGTTVYPAAVQEIMDGSPEVAAWIMVASGGEDLSDQLEVRVALQPGQAESSALSQLSERLRGRLKVSPQLTLADRGQLEAMQKGFRKRRVFVDQRQGR